MQTITKTQLAEYLGYSDTTITKFVKKGMPVHSGGGKGVLTTFVPKDCIDWYVKYKVSEALTGNVGEGDDKALNLKKQNQLLDIKIEKESIAVNGLLGKLYDADVVDELWATRILEFKSALEALIPKLAFMLTNATTQLERTAIIEREFNTLMMSLSEQMIYNKDLELFKDLLEEVKEELSDEENE